MSDKYVRITLRIPPDLHAQAVELAKQMERSLNGEMVYLMRLGVANVAPDAGHKETQAEPKSN